MTIDEQIEQTAQTHANVMTYPSEKILALLSAGGVQFTVIDGDLWVRNEHAAAAKALFDWNWKFDIR